MCLSAISRGTENLIAEKENHRKQVFSYNETLDGSIQKFAKEFPGHEAWKKKLSLLML